MKDSPTHELFNGINSIPKDNINSALQKVNSVNMRLAKENIITEPETSRAQITENTFDKMTIIENIITQSDTNNTLKSLHIDRSTKAQKLKAELNAVVKNKTNEEIVNDVIGG